MALFGEKYSDTVRVVIIDPAYSIELCGGTHVGHTGELGFFKIKHETAVAAGVRRIEAVSGKAAEEFISQQLEQLHSLRETKCPLREDSGDQSRSRQSTPRFVQRQHHAPQ